MPTLGWAARLPQRRPGGPRRGRAALRRPRRRPGQDRRPPDRAGRDRQRAARAARRRRRGRRGPHVRTPATSCSSATSTVDDVRRRRGRGDAPRADCRPRWCRGSRRRRHPDPDVRQGRPRRAAVAAAAPSRPRRRRRSTGTAGVDRRALARRPRRAVREPRTDDFFDLGGGSLTAAQMVSLLRARPPRGGGRRHLRPPDDREARRLPRRARRRRPTTPRDRSVPPTPFKTQAGQVVAVTLLRLARRASVARPGSRPPRNVVGAAVRRRLAAHHALVGASPSRPACSWRLRAGCCWRRSAPGCVLRGVGPGEHPARRQGPPPALGGRAAGRRAWARPASPGAPYMTWYARLLGAQVGRDVDLHSIPPVTGFLHLGSGALDRAGGRPQRLLDRRRRAAGRRGPGRQAGPRSAPRSMLCPGADVGDDAEVAAGLGRLRHGARTASSGPAPRRAGSPAPARGPWSDRPARHAGVGGRVRRHRHATWPCSRCSPSSPARRCRSRGRRSRRRRRAVVVAAAPCCPGSCPARSSGWLVLALLVLGAVRLCARGLRAGRLPGAQPGRPAGVGDHAGARRGAHLAVPALLLAC